MAWMLKSIATGKQQIPMGEGGIVQACHLFEHAKKWKEEGKIKHLGFSFHSSAKLLERILTEHPVIYPFAGSAVAVNLLIFIHTP